MRQRPHVLEVRVVRDRVGLGLDGLQTVDELGRRGGPVGDPGLLPDPLVVEESGERSHRALPVDLAVDRGEVGEQVLLRALGHGAEGGEELRVVVLLDHGGDHQHIAVVLRVHTDLDLALVVREGVELDLDLRIGLVELGGVLLHRAVLHEVGPVGEDRDRAGHLGRVDGGLGVRALRRASASGTARGQQCGGEETSGEFRAAVHLHQLRSGTDEHEWDGWFRTLAAATKPVKSLFRPTIQECVPALLSDGLYRFRSAHAGRHADRPRDGSCGTTGPRSPPRCRAVCTRICSRRGSSRTRSSGGTRPRWRGWGGATGCTRRRSPRSREGTSRRTSSSTVSTPRRRSGSTAGSSAPYGTCTARTASTSRA